MSDPVSGLVVFRHWGLLCRAVGRDLAARYAGTSLGVAWAVLYPLTVLGVYAVVYFWVLGVRIEGLSGAQYALYMFAGLVPFLSMSEAITSGVGSIAANRHLLSNITFPIDLVPVRALLASQVTMAAGFVAILIGAGATGNLHSTTLIVPLLWVCQVLALCGLLWVLALVHIIIRDIQQVAGALLLVTLVASPIAYSPSMVPARLLPFVELNPFAHFVVAYQQAAVLGQWPSPTALAGIVSGSAVAFLAGGWWFARSKRALIDHV